MSELTAKLEALIEGQAMGLAEQHLQSGQAAARQIRQEAQARLQQLQTAEERCFQHEAEQRYRQILQAAKLRLDADTDRVRWALAQQVLSEVRARLDKLPGDFAHYKTALTQYLTEASAAMPDGDLVAELLPRDIELLRGDWDALVAQAAPGRKVALVALQDFATGGLRVSNTTGSLRLDNTFEGRLLRLENTLLASIMEILFFGEAT